MPQSRIQRPKPKPVKPATAKVRAAGVKPPTKKGNRYHHGDLRNALLEETRRALDDMAAQDLSLRLVARRVGVSEAAPSRHFAGLNELLAAVAAQGFHELAAERRKVAASDETPRRKLYLMMKCYVDFARRNRGLFGLMVGPRILNRDIHTALQDASRTSFEMFAGAIRDFATEKGWPKKAIPLLVHAGWSVEHGAARLINDNRVPGFDYLVELDDMVDFSIRMLVSGIERGQASFPPRGC